MLESNMDQFYGPGGRREGSGCAWRPGVLRRRCTALQTLDGTPRRCEGHAFLRANQFCSRGRYARDVACEGSFGDVVPSSVCLVGVGAFGNAQKVSRKV